MCYRRILPEKARVGGVALLRSYPEAVNWFLTTYVQPHALGLAQERYA